MKASIKRELKEGMSLTVMKFEIKEGVEETHKSLGVARDILHRQTNAITFNGGSWLHFGPASQSEWIDDDTFRCWEIDREGNRCAIITYKINR